ncbi:TauD/TfdA family dioxygenase [Streptomyces sp. NPDC050619]|uniref:TauD/TfdA family dioxygenase n=1 Tax=Streptomyces sp. NPDC050619 TaxID=3157214 RepID=UPI00343CB5F4
MSKNSQTLKFQENREQLAALSWTRQDAQSDNSWRVEVSAEVKKEFQELVASFDLTDAVLDTIEADDVELPLLAELAQRTRRQILGRYGFAHVVGLTESGFSEIETRLFYVLLSLHMGKMMTTYGRLHDVKDRGYDFRSVDVSVSKTRVEAPFHTDSTSRRIFPNVFGLLCLRPAMEGGRSLLVSGCQAYSEIADETPEHLPALFKDHYRNTVTPGDEKTSIFDNAFPVYSWGTFSQGPTLRYMRHWIETGYEKASATLTAGDAAAFDRLDAVLEKDENVLGVDLDAGEILFFNNCTVAHNRTAFVDFPEDDRKRLLARAWLQVPERD